MHYPAFHRKVSVINEQILCANNNIRMQIERTVVTQELTRAELNQMCPGGIRGLYNTLRFKGWCLPDFDSKCITAKYLIGIMNGTHYALKAADVREKSVYQKVTAISLCEDLFSKFEEAKFGFTVGNPPDLAWLIKVIAKLIPDHHMFQPLPARRDEVKITIEKEFVFFFTYSKKSFFKDVPKHLLDSDIGNGSLLLKRETSEIIEEKCVKFRGIIEKLKKKAARKTKELEELAKTTRKYEEKVIKYTALNQ